jgi:NitT/TauT family transport system substrate-binding protein
MSSKVVAFMSAFSVAVALACPPANAQEVVKFASVGGMTDAGVYLAEELGFFKNANLKVEMQRIPNAPSLTTAIATNQIDVAGISVTPGLYASVQQGMNLKIVGDKQSMRPGFAATQLVMRTELGKGSEAENVKALVGKKVAVSAKPSISYMLLVALLKKYGLAQDSIQAVELSYPNMMPALASGAVDAAVSLEPFLSQAIQSKVAIPVSDLVEVTPGKGSSVVPLVYSENMIKRHEVAQNFMTAYMQGVRVYNDAFSPGKSKDREKVVEIIARRAGVNAKVVREANKGGLDPNQLVGIPELEAFQKFFVEQNYLRQPIDVAKIVDQSFAKAVVAKLGEYK